MQNTNKKLFSYIKKGVTAYHAVKNTADILTENGYEFISEADEWVLTPGKKYFTKRNGSSLIAFRVPTGNYTGFMMTASHCDSPCFKVKESPERSDSHYVRLSTETYGGMLLASWFDTPLSVAGRVTVRNGNGIEIKLADIGDTVGIIPSVAIHMNRKANENASYNPASDMLPLFSDASSKENPDLLSMVAEAAGVEKKDIVTTDLFAYNPKDGTEFGGFISAPRIDDLQCAFGALEAFISSGESKNSLPVYCLFDNEEVGSTTKQGAASTFLSDTLERIVTGTGGKCKNLKTKLQHSFLVSCDNAHAAHPNHPELSDPNHSVYMNGGIVIKYNANQRYTTDAVSSAIFRLICEKADVPVQSYANRADMPGGSTLGNIANTHVSLNTVDIGLAQLAMHSSYETAGAKDTDYLISALKKFYESSLIVSDSGYGID